MEYKRADRVGDQIQREVSRMLHEEIKDPRIGMVTISRVQVSSDLHYAKIYFTVYGDEAQRRETAEGLNKASSFIRRQLGQYLRLRLTPEISFHYDDSLEHVARISSLLHEIEMQNAGSGKKEPARGGPKRKVAAKDEAEPDDADLEDSELDSVDAIADDVDADDDGDEDDPEHPDELDGDSDEPDEDDEDPDEDDEDPDEDDEDPDDEDGQDSAS